MFFNAWNKCVLANVVKLPRYSPNKGFEIWMPNLIQNGRRQRAIRVLSQQASWFNSAWVNHCPLQ